MTPIQKRYAELLSLTQLFLLREYALTEVNIVDPTAFAFLRTKMKSSQPLNRLKKMEDSPLPNTMPRSQPTQMPVRAITSPPSPDYHPPEAPPSPPPPTPSPSPKPPESITPNPDIPPIPDKIERSKQASKGLALMPLGESSHSHTPHEFWKIFPLIFPALPLRESIPSDSYAKKVKDAWLKDQAMTPVIILAFQDEEPQLTFLKNIAHAISLHLAPARVLSVPKSEKENSWENILKLPTLRLIIASDYGLYLQPGLMKFYSENVQQGKHFLNQVPLLLLSDLSFYLKDPQLKSLLWRAIRNEFAAAQMPILHSR
jgi:hypothetical protein